MSLASTPGAVALIVVPTVAIALSGMTVDGVVIGTGIRFVWWITIGSIGLQTLLTSTFDLHWPLALACVAASVIILVDLTAGRPGRS